jgi:hypothetical protein
MTSFCIKVQLLIAGLGLAGAAAADYPLWDVKVRAAVSPDIPLAVGDIVTITCPWNVDMVSSRGGNYAAVYTGKGSIWYSFDGRREQIYVTALLGESSAFEGKPFSHDFRIPAAGQHTFECEADFGTMKESTLDNNRATVVVNAAPPIERGRSAKNASRPEATTANDPQQARPAPQNSPQPSGPATNARTAPPQPGDVTAKATAAPQLAAGRTSPQPSASGPVAAATPVMAKGTISGQVRLDKWCKLNSNQFDILLDGKLPKPGTYSTKEVEVEESLTAFGIETSKTIERLYTFEFTDLLAGNYQLSIKTKTMQYPCPAGNWEPDLRNVSLAHGAMNATYQIFTHKTLIEERHVNGSVLTASIEGAAKGTEMKLHNYGFKIGDSWYAKDKSYIKLGPGLGGQKLVFGFGGAEQDPWRYYVRDVYMSSADATLTDTQIRLRLHFEDEGEELKGHCSTSKIAYELACLVGDDKAAPDVDMTNIWLDVLFTPGVDNKGRVVVVSASANFHADLQAQGVCNIVDICNLLTGYKTNVEKSVNATIIGLITSPLVMDSVSNALATAMAKLKIGYAIDARIENGDLVVKHIPGKKIGS